MNILPDNDFKEIIEKERDQIITQILDRLPKAIEENLDTIHFDVTLTVQGISTVLIARYPKGQWLPLLSVILKFYIEAELYEKCAEIQKLIDILSEKK